MREGGELMKTNASLGTAAEGSLLRGALEQTRVASSERPDAADAVLELRAALASEALRGVLFFCASTYDLAALGSALRTAFGGAPTVGCTSSGQLSPYGFQKTGVVAVGFYGSGFTLTPWLIEDLTQCAARVVEVATQINERRTAPGHLSNAFVLTLIDGLSMAEEAVSAALYQAVGNVAVVGGSAGDDLAFQLTHVYFNGRFVTGAALVVLVETEAPVVAFKFQHFVPTEKRLVVTRADEAGRIIHELDGEPAATVYARAVGVPEASLGTVVFSENPLLLSISGEPYVRSIARVETDGSGSLHFFCAIAEGMVVRVGRSVDVLETVERALTQADHDVGGADVILGCDCILRRLECERLELSSPVGRAYAAHRVVGFSTYGEQYNGMHVNQTFTGVALGKAPR